MAARRLLIVMVILLVISTVVAVIAPRPVDDGEDNGEDAEQTRPVDSPGWGPATGRGDDVRHIEIEAGGEPTAVRASVGEHLTIHVSDPRGRVIAMPELGLYEPTGPGTPARFDLLPRMPETVEITALNPDQDVADLFILP